MEAAGIKMSESDTWRVKLNIPFELIGSNFNNGKKNSLEKKKTPKPGIREQVFRSRILSNLKFMTPFGDEVGREQDEPRVWSIQ